MSIQNILVIGENVGRTKQRILTMSRLGYKINVLSAVPDDYQPGINEHITFVDRMRNKLGFPADKTHLNKRLLQQIADPRSLIPDLLWVEKSLVLKATTLNKIKNKYPSLIVAWFSEDDMFARHNQSYYFRKSLPLYDIVFTTKSYNCDPNELPAMGAKKVFFVDKSYAPTLHRPITLSAEDQNKYAADVAFIGTFEQDRFEKMRTLAEKGVRIRVWGNGWKNYVNVYPNLKIENKPIYDEEFVKALQATKINLCFLRKINRDLQTDRTMEIPACNAFMLAERTNEHLRLFEENKEAAYFDINDPNELYEKVQYFLKHPEEREAIANNGYQRCIRSHYSHEDRLRYMLGLANDVLKNQQTAIQKILIVGDNIGRTRQRILAIRRIGYHADVLSAVPDDYQPGINDKIIFWDRVRNKLGFPSDKTNLNQRVLNQLEKKKYDLFWVEKSLILKKSTLKAIKNTYPFLKIVWFSEDDMFARHNQSYYFRKSLPLYDVVFTAKSYNCDPNELSAMGAKKVVFFNQSYDPELHKHIQLSQDDIKKYAADVTFIGTFEQDRYQKMLALAKRGIPIRIWGNGWKPYIKSHPNLLIENKPIYDEEFVKAIRAAKINLCFLRKINRDLHTSRSLEIPACNAFMLAERTNEHLQLFEENKEAAYFDINDSNELYEKVQYFLQHPKEREAIANNGYQRCIQSHYSHDDRLRYIFGQIDLLFKNHYTA